VPPTYDSLLGKLIVHRRNRSEAIITMKRALEEFLIHPTRTTVPLCREILLHPAFQQGRCNTNFIEQEILGS
jgi:acetyl-CoA carboxylase biotin carboxylase subunit